MWPLPSSAQPVTVPVFLLLPLLVSLRKARRVPSPRPPLSLPSIPFVSPVRAAEGRAEGQRVGALPGTPDSQPGSLGELPSNWTQAQTLPALK